MIKSFLEGMGIFFIVIIVMLVIMALYVSIKNRIRLNKIKKQKEQDIAINELKRFIFSYMQRSYDLEAKVSTDKVIDDFILIVARIMTERERKGMSITEFNEKTDKYKKKLTEELTKEYKRFSVLAAVKGE